MVITGLRILIGVQDHNRAPLNVTIHGRTINTVATRQRWFDLPLTREESLLSDKRLIIHFGASQDAEQVVILDSIKIYGKTKDVFGWPDETDEIGSTSNAAATAGGAGSSQTGTGQPAGTDSENSGHQLITPLDKMVAQMLEVVDSGFSLLNGDDNGANLRDMAVEIATALIILPTANPVQNQARSLLATLHGSKQAYYHYKDREILKDVNAELRTMIEMKNYRNIDPEAFNRLVLLVRGIAIQRPQALTKICTENKYPILATMMNLMKELHKITPSYEEPYSIVKYGLSHTEAVVHSLVEIMYAFALSDFDLVESMMKFLVDLLLDPAVVISHSAKHSAIRLLRPRLKPQRPPRRVLIVNSPPTCSTPTPSSAPPIEAGQSVSGEAAHAAQNVAVNEDADFGAAAGVDEPLEVAVGGGNPALASLEALLGVAGFPMDLQQDADDDTIMEIAIALSLQENDYDMQALQASLANLQGLRGRSIQALANVVGAGVGVGAGGVEEEVGYNNDAAASTSDDDGEGSNAATDGSTLRTSPAEPAGSGGSAGGSESGGSVAESICGTSGRSSTYGGEGMQPSTPPRASDMNNPAANLQEGAPSNEPEDLNDRETALKLHTLRLLILNRLIGNFKALDNVSGAQAIPFLQVILMLTTDIDGSQESDQMVLTKLLTALVDRLEMSPSAQATAMTNRTARSEVKLNILRLMGVLMGKVKSSSSKSGASSSAHAAQIDNIAYVASATANTLMKNNAIPFCLQILESFLPYWKNFVASGNLPVFTTDAGTSIYAQTTSASAATAAGSSPNTLLKKTQYGPVPDMQPFFTRQYVKSCSDIFELYPQVLTEMAVRLPYQIMKLSSGSLASYEWYQTSGEFMTYTLCEYMMSVPIHLWHQGKVSAIARRSLAGHAHEVREKVLRKELVTNIGGHVHHNAGTVVRLVGRTDRALARLRRNLLVPHGQLATLLLVQRGHFADTAADQLLPAGGGRFIDHLAVAASGRLQPTTNRVVGETGRGGQARQRPWRQCGTQRP
jgi:E3 ubiquitin-protein ligase UBR4